MADVNDLRQRFENILSGASTAGKERATLRAAAQPGTPAPRRFSAFVDEDLARASTIATELMEIAKTRGGDEGIADAVASVEHRLGTEMPGLLEYAVKLFVTHYPEARERFKLPPLEKRQLRGAPAAPAEAPTEEDSRPSAALAVAEAKPWGVATPPEDRVSFWREDPLLNEHHEHWHLVYPYNPPAPSGLGDRHGELFGYMHEQMLARYNAERLAVGLPKVEAFSNMRAMIPQGYDAGKFKLWADGGGWYSYRPRPAGATISDLLRVFANRAGSLIANQEKFRDQLLQVAKDGKFVVRGQEIKADIDRFGASAEGSIGAPDYFGKGDAANFTVYGNLHNDGHIHLMAFDDDPSVPYGVMADTTTAVRDPIFFRWHKLVDSLYFAWQEQQPHNDFSDAPKVKLTGLLVAATTAMPADLDGALFGSKAYRDKLSADLKDANLAGPVRLGGHTITPVNHLTTEMLSRHVTGAPDDPQPVPPVPYVSHDDFVYLIQAENKLGAPQTVTVRIFMAPETEIEDRQAWIEMDRFLYRLEANEKALIFRKSEDSSVVRKPALKPEDLTPDDEPGAKTDSQSWCDCGWPYTMLLPRGTKEGMGYRMMAMFSPGDDMMLPNMTGKCSSISYCGLEGGGYPDKRPMGYPFARRFDKSISETIEKQDNMAASPITIRWK